MSDEAVERHQLAGFDDRERGFNRPVECEPTAAGFRAVLRYEAARVTAEHPVSATRALEELVRTLHQQGYRELRSQLSFKYPDPAYVQELPRGVWQKLLHWMHRTVAAR